MNILSKMFGLGFMALAALNNADGMQRPLGRITSRLRQVTSYLQQHGMPRNAVPVAAGRILNCGDMSVQLKNCLAIRENDGHKYLVLNLARTDVDGFNALLNRTNQESADGEMSLRIAGGIDGLRNMVLQNTVALFGVHQNRNRYNELQGYLADPIPQNLVDEAYAELGASRNVQTTNR